MHWSALTLALAALATAPQLVAAGMYREPVKELDSKSWNRVMSVEHASVSGRWSFCQTDEALQTAFSTAP